MKSNKSAQCIKVIQRAINVLKKTNRTPKILIKVSRNLGDTLHATPIISHYRKKFPNAAIVFLCETRYLNAHKYNPEVDAVFGLPNDLTPQERLALWKPIKNNPHIDIPIIPAIHPFGSVHKSNVWSFEAISNQYLWNAGIRGNGGPQPLAGRKLVIRTLDEDVRFAKAFLKKNNLKPERTWALEYHSYSGQPKWRGNDFAKLVKLTNCANFISIAGKKEGLIPHTVDGRGLSWRRTAALINLCAGIVGVGSGITMIAASCPNKPTIIELDIPNSISMKGCGYADSIVVKNANPEKVSRIIKKRYK